MQLILQFCTTDPILYIAEYVIFILEFRGWALLLWNHVDIFCLSNCICHLVHFV